MSEGHCFCQVVLSAYVPSLGLATTPSLPFGLRGGDGSPPMLAWGNGTVPVGQAYPAYVSSSAKGALPLSLRCTGELRPCMHRRWLAPGGSQGMAVAPLPWREWHPGHTAPQAPAQGWACLGDGRGWTREKRDLPHGVFLAGVVRQLARKWKDRCFRAW